MTYTEVLKNLLDKHLESFIFEEGNSLLECDFFDTYSNTISNKLNIYKTDASSIGPWDVDEQHYINSVIKKYGKYIDPYMTWKSVPLTYLKKYHYGITYLKPMSYKFYLISFIWNYVKNKNLFIEEIDFLYQWFDSLYPLDENFNINQKMLTQFSEFSSIEGRLISYFLFCIYHEPLVSKEIKNWAKDTNYSFWITWKYIVS